MSNFINEISSLKENLKSKEEEIYNLTKKYKDILLVLKYEKYINEKLRKEIQKLNNNIEKYKIEKIKNSYKSNKITSYSLKIISSLNNSLNNLYCNLPFVTNNLINMNYNNFFKLKGSNIINKIKINEWNKLLKLITKSKHKTKLNIIFNNLDKKLENKYYDNFINGYSKLLDKLKNVEVENISFSIPNEEIEQEEISLSNNNIYKFVSDRKIKKKFTIDLIEANNEANKRKFRNLRSKTTNITEDIKIEKDTNDDNHSFFQEINNLKIFNNNNLNNTNTDLSVKSLEFNKKINKENISNFISNILKNYKNIKNLDTEAELSLLSAYISNEIKNYIKYFIEKIKNLQKFLNDIVYNFIQYILIIPKKFINVVYNFQKYFNTSDNDFLIKIMETITFNINNLNYHFNEKNYPNFIKEINKHREYIEREFLDKIIKYVNI